MTERDALWFATEPDVLLSDAPAKSGDLGDLGDLEAAMLSSGAPRGRQRRWARRSIVGSLVVCGLFAAYFVVCLAQVWSTGQSDQARPVDAIVVLGAAQYDGRPSPQLAARLDHAAELYADGVAPLVVVTGGKQPADRYTEAGASALYLIAAGVPPHVIVQEDRGRSTWESLEGVSRLLHDRRLDSVMLVTDPYHSLRSRYIAGELGLRAYTSPTRTSPVRGFTAFKRELKEASGIAVGRVVGFERLWRVTG